MRPALFVFAACRYAAGRYNAGHCRADAGVCAACPCECARECGAEDACPLDPRNDLDSDALCAGEDSCPYVSTNVVTSTTERCVRVLCYVRMCICACLRACARACVSACKTITEGSLPATIE